MILSHHRESKISSRHSDPPNWKKKCNDNTGRGNDSGLWTILMEKSQTKKQGKDWRKSWRQWKHAYFYLHLRPRSPISSLLIGYLPFHITSHAHTHSHDSAVVGFPHKHQDLGRKCCARFNVYNCQPRLFSKPNMETNSLLTPPGYSYRKILRQ